MKRIMKDLWENFVHYFYYRGVRRLIPKYHGRTIFTKFYWRTWWDRRTKGFDESCTWSLDYTFTQFIAPRLNAFAYTYDLGRVSVPNSILEAEQKVSMAKGYEWDERRWQLADKKERRRCWDRAIKRWTNILHEMADGFNDMKLEEDDWDAWQKKWTPVVDKWNKKLDKAKTIKEKQIIWGQIGTWREFRPGFGVNVDDVVWCMRERAMDLFRKYYNALWW